VTGNGFVRDAVARHWRRLLAAVALLLVAGLIIASADLHAAINRALAAVESLRLAHPLAGMVAFVLLAALSAMIAFFSSAVLVPAGVVAWGVPVTFALLWLGWLAGGVAAYVIARQLGRPVVLWMVRADQLRHYEERLAADAPFSVVLLLQLALPSEVPGYVVGILRYPFGRYLGALALAELPFAAAAVLLGDSFVRGDLQRLAVVGIAGIAISAVAVVAWHRHNHAAGHPP
jgi:uncharacterized membrane protein YdjX (TVP38/TMEM64 family)